MKTRIIIAVLSLATIGAATERAHNLYHAHKLSERRVAISCDQGKPTVISQDADVVEVACK